MIDNKSDPGAWADEIASTGRFRAVAAPAWKLVPGELVPEMQNALWGQANFGLTPEDYVLLIAAAPEPPADPRDAEIAALRAEVEAERNRRFEGNRIASEEANAEIAALKAEVENMTLLLEEYKASEKQAVESRERLTSILYNNGFRVCDIAECNCGSWHQIGGFAARFREIEDASADEWRNGETLLTRIERIMLDLQALRGEGSHD